MRCRRQGRSGKWCEFPVDTHPRKGHLTMDEYLNGSTPEPENQDLPAGSGTDSAAGSPHQDTENAKPPAAESPAQDDASPVEDSSSPDQNANQGAEDNAGTYRNQNTGSYSNDSHWGTYEDWNFGNIEAKKAAEEKKQQAYSGHTDRADIREAATVHTDRMNIPETLQIRDITAGMTHIGSAHRRMRKRPAPIS